MERTQSGRRFYARPPECSEGIDQERTLEELFERRREITNTIEELEDNIASITDQLALAKECKELTGKNVDVEWAGRAAAAMRGYRRVYREPSSTRGAGRRGSRVTL